MDTMVASLGVDRARRHQRIDGFGFCEGFGRARILRGSQGLPAEAAGEVLELLLGPRGAALSILRLCIGASALEGPGEMRSFAAVGPGSPDEPLVYDWDGDDAGQVWLARQAATFGVRRFFAHPLSAPAYMLHRPGGRYDGLIRGMRGTGAEAGDWRAAYAEYLLQYVRYYAAHGVDITDLGIAHQPDVLHHRPGQRIRYPLLKLEPADVVDLVSSIGARIAHAGPDVKLVCGDAISWDSQVEYTAAVEADEVAAGYVGLHAGNSYLTPARRPLPTTRPTWMTEWDPEVDQQSTRWNDAWDSGRASDAILLADDIHGALTAANVSGYLYLFGASARESTRALIQLAGPTFHVSRRLWAMAAYSRFIRPGAHRVDARLTPDDGRLKVSAFTGPDSRVVLQALNLGDRGADFTVALSPALPAATVHAWLTDERHTLAPLAPRSTADVHHVPARSLTTFQLGPDASRER